MDFSMKEAGNTLEVMMNGRFTFSENQKFKTIIHQSLSSKPSVLIFDLSKVEFIDSAGLGMLLLAKDEMDSVGASILLRGAAGQVKKMLNVSCFEVLFGMA
jgi:anti-anti-sigma factor